MNEVAPTTPTTTNQLKRSRKDRASSSVEGLNNSDFEGFTCKIRLLESHDTVGSLPQPHDLFNQEPGVTDSGSAKSAVYTSLKKADAEKVILKEKKSTDEDEPNQVQVVHRETTSACGRPTPKPTAAKLILVQSCPSTSQALPPPAPSIQSVEKAANEITVADNADLTTETGSSTTQPNHSDNIKVGVVDVPAAPQGTTIPEDTQDTTEAEDGSRDAKSQGKSTIGHMLLKLLPCNCSNYHNQR